MADKMQVDIPPFSDALEKIWRARKDGWASLQKCVLPVAGVVDEQGRHLGAVDEMFDLSFLDALRSERDFLPQQLFVRKEVRDMFSKLASAHEGRVLSRVLTGSPGIGKSVVFFLAAVQRAATIDKRLIYLRKRDEEEDISVFIMDNSPNGDSVDVVFGRELPKRRIPNLTELVNTIIDSSELADDAFYIMLDGPKHNDPRPDRLYNTYSSLCTSGGYPALKQEQIGVKEILVLSGWTEAKMKEAMGEMNIQEPNKKYDLSGGRIRLALLSDTEIKQWFDEVVESIGPRAIKLAVTSNVATGCTDSSDRLRTRFFHIEGEKRVSNMIVDSRYAFNLLKERLDGEDILEAYNLAKVLGLKAAQGWFYEEILHRHFRELKREPYSSIKDWKHEEGTGVDGVASFVAECVQGKTGIYWAPGIPNFANIVAAILQESHTLICFQCTVQASHAFDKQSFWGDFVNHLVVNQVQIKGVRVVFVTPSDVTFDLKSHQAYFQDFSSREETHTRKSPLSRIPVSFSNVSVDAASSLEVVAEKLLTNPAV